MAFFDESIYDPALLQQNDAVMANNDTQQNGKAESRTKQDPGSENETNSENRKDGATA